MSNISNIPYNARSVNGVITLSDGNGTIISNGQITTGDINSNSFATNDFSVNTNIDLTGDTSKIQFTFDASQNAFIDRNSVNFDHINAGTIYDASYALTVNTNHKKYGECPDIGGQVFETITRANVNGVQNDYLRIREEIGNDGGIHYPIFFIEGWNDADLIWYELFKIDGFSTTITINSLNVMSGFTTSVLNAQALNLTGSYNVISQDYITSYINSLNSTTFSGTNTYPLDLATFQTNPSNTTANGGNIYFRRLKPSASNNDVIFNLIFRGNNSTGSQGSLVNYNSIVSSIQDAVFATRTGRIKITNMISGTTKDMLVCDSNGVTIPNDIDLNCFNINLTNINGSPYVAGGSQTLSQTLSYGNSAGTYDIDMSNNSILNNNNLTSTGTNILKQVQSYPPSWTTSQATLYKSIALGYDNFTTLTGTSGNTYNVGIGINNANDNTTANNFTQNNFLGYNNLTSTMTSGNTIQYNSIQGTSNFVGSLPTLMTYNTIIGNNNYGASSQAQTFSYNSIIGNNNTFLSTGSSLSYSTIIGTTNTMNGGGRTLIIGNNNQVQGNYTGAIGFGLTNSTPSSILFGGLDASSNRIRSVYYGLVQFQYGMWQSTKYITMTGNITLGEDALGGVVYINSATANNQQINLPATSYTGAMFEVHNGSLYYLTIQSTSQIRGLYGSFSTGMGIAPGQIIKLYNPTGGNWFVSDIRGVPFGYQRYNTATQTLAVAGANYAVLFPTLANGVPSTGTTGTANASNTWYGSQLTYTAGTGTFTNNVGFPLTVEIDVDVYTGLSATVTCYLFINTNTRHVYSEYSGLQFLPPNTSSTLHLKRTLLMGAGDFFTIGIQTNGTNYVIGSTTAGRQNRITITRL